MTLQSSLPVVVSGTGLVSCAGNSPQELWQSALRGHSGIRDGLGRVDGSALQFSLQAAAQALQQAGWKNLTPEDGLILATTTGQIPLWDEALVDFLRHKISRESFERAFVHQPIGSLLDSFGDALDFSGQSLLVSSACTSATQAIALGALWIKQGRVKRCLVVGVEILCTLTIEGFKCLQLLSPSPAKPFDFERSGINLSEGAAALCLESNAPGVEALARISGFGLSTDSYHMTAPEPEGRGCFQAMRAALELARLKPQEVSWVHAHGTGSQHNDLAEGKALARLFGAEMPFVSSTKNIHGHSLGASGAIESVLCVEALQRQHVLKTAGLEKPDPAIAIHHPLESQPVQLDHILKNTLGFGGTNAALVFTRSGFVRADLFESEKARPS